MRGQFPTLPELLQMTYTFPLRLTILQGNSLTAAAYPAAYRSRRDLHDYKQAAYLQASHNLRTADLTLMLGS